MSDTAPLLIRSASQAEFAQAVEWAAAEGWNPGLDDLPAFFAADPEGFLMGFRDGRAVSSISVVRYGPDYGFLGFYIVRPDRRGTGDGIATWRAGMARLEGRVIGLDGVPAQQDNYRKEGFRLAGRNIRFTGAPARTPAPRGVELRPIGAAEIAAVAVWERPFFPAWRHEFTTLWAGPGPARRRGLVALRDGDVAGYGVIRTCRQGFKIGPLFADDREAAEALFSGLCADIPAGATVALDVPEPHGAAMALARSAGLAPAFETARMYRGRAPKLPIERTFGVTTFELG
ncbi:MAG: GNAT family N-acetyltransferase [Rhodobacteraceae bacterium]|nr:GNAT family N-acetyltransferase [Paracoccaceae bacterium]MBR28892.1 GNAT family N-acetyltransferase [Paracoccaceae bacterium]